MNLRSCRLKLKSNNVRKANIIKWLSQISLLSSINKSFKMNFQANSYSGKRTIIMMGVIIMLIIRNNKMKPYTQPIRVIIHKRLNVTRRINTTTTLNSQCKTLQVFIPANSIYLYQEKRCLRSEVTLVLRDSHQLRHR